MNIETVFTDKKEVARYLKVDVREILAIGDAAYACDVTGGAIYYRADNGQMRRFETDNGAVFHVPFSMRKNHIKEVVDEKPTENFIVIEKAAADDVTISDIEYGDMSREDLLAELAGAEAEIENLEIELGELSDLEINHVEIAKLKTDIQKVCAKKDSLEMEVSRYRTLYRFNEAQKDALKEQEIKHVEMINNLRHALSGLRRERREMEGRIADLQQALRAAQNKNTAKVYGAEAVGVGSCDGNESELGAHAYLNETKRRPGLLGKVADKAARAFVGVITGGAK